MPQHLEIKRAIEIVGSQPRLAEASGISQQHISKILNGERRVTAEIALAIERATEAQIGRWQLRPDLWDAPVTAEANAA